MISELLDEYKETDDHRKEILVNEFINRLWKSNYTYKTYKKYYTYIVKDELLDNKIDLVELFNKYSIIEYSVCRSFYDKQLSPFDYIRIHINNMFGYLTDKDVYLSKEYYQLLLTPKHEYFSTINKLKNGESVDCKEIEDRISSGFATAEIIKEQSIAKKLNISWSEYKKLINSYIKRLFNNYIPLEEYESKHGWEMHVNVDGWSEDNYIVKYFCKSLTGYLKTHIRDSKVKMKKCVLCGEEIGRRGKYCTECFKKHRRKYKTNKQKEYRENVNVDSKCYLSE